MLLEEVMEAQVDFDKEKDFEKWFNLE